MSSNDHDGRGPMKPPARPGQKDFNPGQGAYRPNAGTFVPNAGAFRPGTGYFDPTTGSSAPPGEQPPGVPGQHRGFGAGRIAPRTEIGSTGIQQSQGPASQAPTPIDVPVATVPKGGGAVQPIAEKFAANPATGSGGASVSFALPAFGRGISPSLGLSYDTGAGNGPFGLGWSLGVPSVTRKTDKGLPTYEDSEESDTFILAGAEDLVPELEESGGELVVRDDGTRRHYLPRTEGSFSRIVRVSTANGPYWEVTDKDNVTHIFGKSPEARVADPDRPSRIFTWLLERSEDAYGNVVLYEYKPEDLDNIPAEACEAHRTSSGVAAQKYLKRAFYGNVREPADTEVGPVAPDDFHFEIVFDYGEHTTSPPTPAEVDPWDYRKDRLSTYRAGFEVRTYRRCKRVLVFHRFDRLASGAPTLVHATELTYTEPSGAGEGTVSYLTMVEHIGYDGASSARLPAATYEYSTSDDLSSEVKTIDPRSLAGIPGNIDGRLFQWVDLDGEGVPGILTQQGGALRYKRNRGDGELGASLLLQTQPASTAIAASGGQQLVDLTGSGLPDLVDYEGSKGFYARTRDGGWSRHRPLPQLPTLGPSHPNARMLDLTGDGSADLIMAGDHAYTWWPSLREKGFDGPRRAPRFADDTKGPNLVFAEAQQTVFIADMTGDGLQDLVSLKNGSVGYYPNLGHGRFGPKVQMDGAPHMAPSNQFRPDRVRLADVDGSGPADLIYLSTDGVKLWRNKGGNGFSTSAETIGVFPGVDALATVDVVDMLGSGTACLVWSTPLQGREPRIRYVDLHHSKKPHLLIKSHNGIGLTTTVSYTTSTRQYLEDRRNGIEWVTKVPFPVHVVASVEHYDAVAQHRFVSTYRYRHGFYDGMEREFRGFGYVEQRDAETVSKHVGRGDMTELPDLLNDELRQPPVVTKSWFHTGALGKVGTDLVAQYELEWWDGASPGDGGPRLTMPALPTCETPEERFQAARALRGQLLRQEVHTEVEPLESQTLRPYVITQQTQRVHLVQPARESLAAPFAVFLTTPEESLSVHVEQATDASDARISHELTLETDDLGRVTRSAAVAYGRSTGLTEQTKTWISVSEQGFLDARNATGDHRHSLPSWSKQYELLGMEAPSGLYLRDDVRTAVAEGDEKVFDSTDTPGSMETFLRVLSHQRTLYWKTDFSGPENFDSTPNALAMPYQSFVLALLPTTLSGPLEGRVAATYAKSDGHYVDPTGIGAAFGSAHTDGTVDAASLWATTGVATPATAAKYAAGFNFYQPVTITEPHGTVTDLTYDDTGLFVIETTLNVPGSSLNGLSSSVDLDGSSNPLIDYRILAPTRVVDINGQKMEAAFDELGRVTATAVIGKSGEGDTISAPTAQITYASETTWSSGGTPHWVKTRARTEHAGSTWMESYVYVNGMGAALCTKTLVEDGPAPSRNPDGTIELELDGSPKLVETSPRWLGSGRTVVDNKGNPIKQYEPYFSDRPDFDPDEVFEPVGVSPLFIYDPVGRLVRVDYPDGSFERVEFSPWDQTSYDRNDTIDETGNAWKAAHGGTTELTKTQAHADTPTVTQLDGLGRPFRVEEDDGSASLPLVTTSVLDIEGNVLEVVDPNGNSAMLFTYGPMGQVVKTESIDAGKRYRFDAAMGEALMHWGERGASASEPYVQRVTYDELRRPTGVFLNDGGTDKQVQEMVYGEGHTNAATHNLRGQMVAHYDQSGLVEWTEFDFKGNPLKTARQLAQALTGILDWSATTPPALETEVFRFTYTYDALNRQKSALTEHDDGSTTVPKAKHLPTYNIGGKLEQVQVVVRDDTTPTTIVESIDYDAKGRRTKIVYADASGTVDRFETAYSYEPLTYRLAHFKTTRIHADASPDKLLQSLAYTYDPVGNILATTDSAAHDLFFTSAPSEDGSRTFKYDALYRLIEATGREHSAFGEVFGHTDETPRTHLADVTGIRDYARSYTYDDNGNLDTMAHAPGGSAPGWTREYQYVSGTNQLSGTKKASETTWNTGYGHDVHGNMTELPHLDLLEWDFADRLRHAEKGTEDTYLVYDASGQRVRKVWDRNGLRDERIYLGGYEIFRQHELNAGTWELKEERETIHVSDDVRRVCMVETKTVTNKLPVGTPTPLFRYQLDDHLGSCCVEVDENGNLITFEEYFPYGTSSFRSATGDVSKKRYRYTGKERDESTGLYYHGARYYAPWLGRWTAADPLAFADGVGSYTYVRGSPVVLSDPTGREGLLTDIANALGFGESRRIGHSSVGATGERAAEESRVYAATRATRRSAPISYNSEDGPPSVRADVPAPSPASRKGQYVDMNPELRTSLRGVAYGGLKALTFGHPEVLGVEPTFEESIDPNFEHRSFQGEAGTGLLTMALGGGPPSATSGGFRVAQQSGGGTAIFGFKIQTLDAGAVTVGSAVGAVSGTAVLEGGIGLSLSTGSGDSDGEQPPSAPQSTPAEPKTSFDEVADHIEDTGSLPSNFITKAQAKKLGWVPKKGNLADVAPGKSIGGDVFHNKGGDLPSAPGRTWAEADIGYTSGHRGANRVLFSNDGLVFKTTDHYKTFTRLK